MPVPAQGIQELMQVKCAWNIPRYTVPSSPFLGVWPGVARPGLTRPQFPEWVLGSRGGWGAEIYLNTKKVEKVRKPSWIISILKFFHVFDYYLIIKYPLFF